MLKPVHIIGAGLAGSEAAWQIARQGVPVIIHEMRPNYMTPVHQGADFAELVCSNSFRSDDAQYNAVGLLHAEMRQADSLIMSTADRHKVAAGGALAVDRNHFAQAITKTLQDHPLIHIQHELVSELPPPDWENTIIATGPLTAEPLLKAICQHAGENSLAFFDAIAPIVYKESINFSIAWKQSRYDKNDRADYINCPLDKDQYRLFIAALRVAPAMPFRDFEKNTPYFEACLPIEVMAARGEETLRYGPMKPVGLTNLHKPDEKAYAVVQLRQDNALDTLYNMVGFQTKMIHSAQTEIFRTIPGLGKAVFARLGGIHRNSFIHAPRLLNQKLQLKSRPDIRFAGQITGVEGYVESAALGLVAGRLSAAQARNQQHPLPPPTTAIGALIAHISGGFIDNQKATFQPMNINYGLFPPLEGLIYRDTQGQPVRGKQKKRFRHFHIAERALKDIKNWC